MIDLGHGYIGGELFETDISLHIPNFDKKKLFDYTPPGGDIELLNILKTKFNIFSIDNITLTLSTNLSFNILLNDCLNKGNYFHVCKPIFSCFYTQIKDKNKIIYYTNFKNFLFDAISNSNKGDNILLINPSNPSGFYLEPSFLFYFMEEANKKGVRIILDITWIFSIYKEKNHLYLLKEIISKSILFNHITIFGISKLLYSPGIRLSCVFGNKIDISYIKGIHDSLAVSCSYFDQEFAKKNIINGKIDYLSINKKLLNNIDIIKIFLINNEYLSVANIPKAGIFMILKSKYEIDLFKLKKDYRVIIYPIKFFGGEGNYYRICIAKDINLLKKGLLRIINYLKDNN